MNVPYKLSCIATVVAAIVITNPVSAADEKAGVIRTESGIDFTPGLNSGLKYDDNITSANASVDKLDSWILTVTPAVQAQLIDGSSVFTLDAGIEYGDYFSSSDDNYLDALIKGKAEVDVNQSRRFGLEATYISGHEEFSKATVVQIRMNQILMMFQVSAAFMNMVLKLPPHVSELMLST